MSGFGFLSALAFACTGWAAFGLAMDRHYADIHGRGKEPTPGARKYCRALGILALLATFAIGVKLAGWSVGPVLSLGTLVAAALLLVLLLTYQPQHLVWFGRVTGTVAILFGVLCWAIA